MEDGKRFCKDLGIGESRNRWNPKASDRALSDAKGDKSPMMEVRKLARAQWPNSAGTVFHVEQSDIVPAAFLAEQIGPDSNIGLIF
jgi:hypothetical protein